MLPSAILWALLYQQMNIDTIRTGRNAASSLSTTTTCQINPRESHPAPLLLDENGFIYPPGSGYNAILLDQQLLHLSCPGGNLVLDGVLTSLEDVVASCNGANELIIAGQRYKWRNIKCSTDPEHVVRRTGNKCENGGSDYEIGFNVSPNRFVMIMKICFNESLETTIYSHAIITRAVNQGVRTTRQQKWDSAFFKTPRLNQLYTRNTQRQTINGLLGLNNDDKAFIRDNNFFLARGQLITKNDYFYGSQQNASFHFLNALPQWQTFKGGNWRTAEVDIRDYAQKHDVDLQVWAGGYGVATLPHKYTGRKTELYLYVNRLQSKIPVPEYFWKVVYEPVSQRGIVLLGINNPYKSRSDFNPLCQDLSIGIRWLTWDPYNQKKGYTWACDVEDFQRRLAIIPKIPIKGLLA